MRDAMKQRAMMTRSLAVSYYVTGLGRVGPDQTAAWGSGNLALPDVLHRLFTLSVCLSVWLADAVVEALSACLGRQWMNEVVILLPTYITPTFPLATIA